MFFEFEFSITEIFYNAILPRSTNEYYGNGKCSRVVGESTVTHRDPARCPGRWWGKSIVPFWESCLTGSIMYEAEAQKRHRQKIPIWESPTCGWQVKEWK